MTARGHWTVVREVISSTAAGADVMSALPGLVERLLDEEAWREFDAPPPAGHIEHRSFRAFVEAKPPGGLGSRLDQLKALCGDRADLAVRVQRMHDDGIPAASPHGTNQHSHTEENVTRSPVGKSDTRDKVVAVLKRDHPDLALRVTRGELSADAAAKQAGIRKPRIVVTSPESVARSLRRHMGPADLARLAELLSEGGVS